MKYTVSEIILKKRHLGGPGWLSWLSIRLLILAQVMISWFMGSSPVLGGLCADSSEPTGDSPSSLLSAPPPLGTCSRTLSHNKHEKNSIKLLQKENRTESLQSWVWQWLLIRYDAKSVSDKRIHELYLIKIKKFCLSEDTIK